MQISCSAGRDTFLFVPFLFYGGIGYHASSGYDRKVPEYTEFLWNSSGITLDNTTQDGDVGDRMGVVYGTYGESVASMDMEALWGRQKCKVQIKGAFAGMMVVSAIKNIQEYFEYKGGEF